MSAALPVEVILLRLPQLLSDIVHSLINGQDDMHVLAEIAEAPALLAAAGGARGRVVVLTAGEVPCQEVLDMLRDLPHGRALAVSDDGRRAVMCELEPRCRALRETSTEEIVRAIRGDGH